MSTQNKNFFTGLMTGIAIVAVIGLIVVLGFYLSDKSVNKETSKTLTKNNNVNSVSDNQPSAPAKINIEISADDHIRGNVDAPITIVEYSDFQCPYCSKFHSTMKQVVEAYPNEVRWVYRHFPLDSIHPIARKAAEASECASDQDKFWEYNDLVYENQQGLSLADLSDFASQLSLNTSQFEECLSSDKYKNRVEAQLQDGLTKGVRGTPGTFINGQKLPGAVPYETIEEIISSLQ
ncbi:DsbA family protein [Patescibacteria group bacterium]